MLLAVTHRYKRARCLWLEQFQIADSVLDVCRVQPSCIAPISTVPVRGPSSEGVTARLPDVAAGEEQTTVLQTAGTCFLA